MSTAGAVSLLLALLALVVAVPLSAPDGSGRQWDNLVLGVVGSAAAVRASRATRGMDRRTLVPWRLMAVCGSLFATASLLTGTGLTPAFGEVGVGDVLLLPAVCIPPLVCGLLASQVRSTRWPAPLVDGAMVTASLLVVSDVLVFSPAADVTPLAAAYGVYAAVAVGTAGALCTVSTRALRRSATAMIASTSLIALATVMLALGIADPSQAWQAVGDVAVVLALEASVLAITSSPLSCSRHEDPRAGAPRVNFLGLAITVGATVGLPVVLVSAVLRGQPLSAAAVVGTAGVVVLLLLRNTLRIRDSGRLIEDLVRTEEDFRELVESSSDGVAIVDGDHRLQFASRAARHLLGLPAEGPLSGSLLDRVDAEDHQRVGAALTAGAVLHFRVTDADGEPTDLEVTHHDRAAGDRRVLQLRDVTTRRRRERELERMAYTDHLTRLPNRAMLFQQMAGGTTERCLLVLDLDGFKAVNDEAGHEAGDHLLVEVAGRLRTVVREQDVVTRLGGDEFAVLVEGTLSEAVEAAQRIVDVLALPHRTAEWTFAIGASVGVSQLRPGSGQLAFREADAALRAAKQAGKGCLRVWDDGRGAQVADSDVATALAEGHVQLRYTLAGTTGEPLRSLHAVPVWQHRTAGLLPAAELWAAAGRQGQDALLQRWVLATATAHAVGLPRQLALAIDLPAGHVQVDQLADDVATALVTADLPAHRLCLALTEDALLTAPAALPGVLHELHAAGVRICLDDYGMGRTLVSHLSRIPLNSIRIDVSALGGRGDDEHTLRVVRAITANAEAFGLMVVAHGVEPGPLLDGVLDAGVQMVRSRATPQLVPIEEVAELLRVPAGEPALR
ncbi:hypothetical protein ASG41_08110 [Modestobacter sp. Leaf380]|nr:hypothetical protein ASG41_08110 [Modestobacter sp. Leaf380]